MKKIALLFAGLFSLLAASAGAQIVNVASKGDGTGGLLFHDGATNIMTINDGADGVDFHQPFDLSGAFILDDGSGASPSLTFTDGTDETVVFSKVDAGFLTATTTAGDGINILVGNLKVGNGTPGTAQDGEDGYIEGGLEVDGPAKFDGAVNATSTLAITGTATANGIFTANGVVNIGDANGDAITYIGTEARSALRTISDHASTTTAVTILAAQNGVHFVLGENGSNPLIFNLPAAVAGMEYWFTDNDATAAADFVVNPDNADTIEDSSAGVSINSTTDEVGPTMGLRAVSASQWVVIAARGTWAEGS